MSPHSTAFASATNSATWPSVWPGLSSTSMRPLPSGTESPGRTARSSGGRRWASAAAPSTFAPVAATTAATPSTWSGWWWVSSTQSSRPGSGIARSAARFAGASPGSHRATVPVASSRSSQA